MSNKIKETTKSTTSPTNPDDIVKALFDKLQEKKKQIESLENPKYKTHLSFGYSEDTSMRMNIATISDTNVLMNIASFLLAKEEANQKAADLLGLKTPKWHNYSIADWLHDLKVRVDKLNIDAKRKEFKQMEEKLNSLVSTERRRMLELEAISKALSDDSEKESE